MEVARIVELLKERFGEALVEEHLEVVDPWIEVRREALVEICRFLRDDPRLEFNQLMCLSGVHVKDDLLWSVCHVFSYTHRHRLGLKVVLGTGDNHCPTLTGIWPAADWHERESYDLVGIVYDGHPDPRRILCPEDWVGHPLRKDYVTPSTYNGMPLD